MRWPLSVASACCRRSVSCFVRSPPRSRPCHGWPNSWESLKQATSRLVDDMVTLGFLQRSEPRGDRGQKRLHPSPAGKRSASARWPKSPEMEDELRQRFGDAQPDALRTLLIDFVERHRGGDELAARRSRVSDPS